MSTNGPLSIDSLIKVLEGVALQNKNLNTTLSDIKTLRSELGSILDKLDRSGPDSVQGRIEAVTRELMEVSDDLDELSCRLVNMDYDLASVGEDLEKGLCITDEAPAAQTNSPAVQINSPARQTRVPAVQTKVPGAQTDSGKTAFELLKPYQKELKKLQREHKSVRATARAFVNQHPELGINPRNLVFYRLLHSTKHKSPFDMFEDEVRSLLKTNHPTVIYDQLLKAHPGLPKKPQFYNWLKNRGMIDAGRSLNRT